MLCATLAAAALLAPAVRADILDPNFYKTDWTDVCETGKAQTPIDLESIDSVEMPAELVSSFKFPNVKGVVLKNTGTALKVEWDKIQGKDNLPEVPVAGDGISAIYQDPTLKPVRKIKVMPAQFHFHTASEHLIEGFYSVAELHIVTFVAKGEAPEWGCDAVWDGGDPVLDKCTAVFGVLYRLGRTSPGWFDKMFQEAPNVVETDKGKPYSAGNFDLNEIIPTDRTYWGYRGSLTTPPCAENLRWHVFKEEPTITLETLQLMTDWFANTTDSKGNKQVGRTNHRLPQPINGRNIFKYRDPNAPTDGTQTPLQSANAAQPEAQPGAAGGTAEAAPNAAVAAPFAALTAAVTVVATLFGAYL